MIRASGRCCIRAHGGEGVETTWILDRTKEDGRFIDLAVHAIRTDRHGQGPERLLAGGNGPRCTLYVTHNRQSVDPPATEFVVDLSFQT